MESIKKLFIFIILFNMVFCSFSQKQFSLNGIITDSITSEPLFGANVYIKNLKKGAVSEENGFYNLLLKPGKYDVTYSYIGYHETTKTINIINGNFTENIILKPMVITGEVVEITASRLDQNVKSTDVGTVEIPINRLKTIPALLGEVDILKSIQLLPGIQAGGEGSNSYYVRGGGADQNLILIDGATVYNPSHLLGFFSVFNADAIENAEIIKAGMSPQYGGRMASVLDITARDGDKQNYSGEIGIGLLSAKALVEGPIQKDKSSFILSARRTYADLFLGLFSKGTPFEGLKYYFYDINGKLSFRLSPKDMLSISGYYGMDKFGMSNNNLGFTNNIFWTNGIGSIKWNHLFNDKLYLSTGFNSSNYKFSISMNEEIYNFGLFSGVNDLSAYSTLGWTINETNKIKAGINYIYHIFTPSTVSADAGMTGFDFGSQDKLRAHDFAAFIQHECDISARWKILYGIRYNFFAQTGPFKRYTIDNYYDMNNIDSVTYKKGEIVKPYHRFEPRFNLRFAIDNNKSLKFSATQNYQFVNLAAMSSISLPADVWFPTTELVKPQGSSQISLGYFQNFNNNKVEASVEVYYKYMTNLIEFREGADISNSMNTNMDYCFTYGKGQSYGIEFFVNKTIGKITGWLGYTLSWSNRNFPEINNGKTFPAKYDRRHDISFLLSYEYKKWVFSAVWVFASGNASTLPASLYIIEGKVVTEWGEHNGWRMPDYHRLDISATWNLINGKHVTGSLNFSIYNVYNRANPYYISFKIEGNTAAGQLQIKPYQVSIFPILPSIGITLKFK